MTNNGSWVLSIESNLNSFRSLVPSLGNLDLGIWSEERGDTGIADYYFTSQHLEGLTDEQEVVDRVRALKSIFDGALLIYDGAKAPIFKISQIENPKGQRSYYYFDGNILADPFKSDAKNWTSSSSNYAENPFRHFVSASLFLSRHNQDIRLMLSFLGFNGITWISLYALRDFLKGFGWSDADICTKTGISAAELKNFTYTANNVQAIGPNARHGIVGHKPPTTPMSLESAANIILKAVKIFMDEKIEEFKMLNGIT